MKNIDLNYICKTIGNLSGIPIRIFEGERPVLFHSTIQLPKDPMVVYQKEIFSIQEHVSYYVTPIFDYYGIVNTGNHKIVLGPSRHAAAGDNDLRELAFYADVKQDEVDEFLSAIKSINPMPLQSIMQTLCVVNYILNGDKLTLEDIQIHDDIQNEFHRQLQREYAEKQIDAQPENFTHNTSLAVEQTILNFIRRGEAEELKLWLKDVPAVRSGILSDDHLRQFKNTFICTATVVSRAGIRGGLNVDEALALSDSYIQKCELLYSADDITNLQYRMVLDFAERVSRLRMGKRLSKLALDVANYVQEHISEPISTEKMAASLFMSRPYLSKKFKEETGMTLTDFILAKKTEEAKRLLCYTDKTIVAISNYLGFSSQSHFTRVFKKYAGISPSDYREKN